MRLNIGDCRPSRVRRAQAVLTMIYVCEDETQSVFDSNDGENDRNTKLFGGVLGFGIENAMAVRCVVSALCC